MQYTIIPVTSYQQNCTLLWCKTTHEGMVVDPGGDIHRIIAAIQQHGICEIYRKSFAPVRRVMEHG